LPDRVKDGRNVADFAMATTGRGGSDVQYDFQYSDTSAYAAVRQLLARFDLAGGLVVDLGCGNCPMADVVRELGGEYVGVDVDAESVSVATERGVESHQVDLARPDVAVPTGQDRVRATGGRGARAGRAGAPRGPGRAADPVARARVPNSARHW